MKIKTSELEGAALDWAVSLSTLDGAPGGRVKEEIGKDVAIRLVLDGYTPSTNWAQGGPLIERMAVNVVNGSSDYTEFSGQWGASCGSPVLLVEAFNGQRYDHQVGPTPLVAACRTIVGEVLGDEVDVPEDLT